MRHISKEFIKKLPEAVGVGIGIGLLSIQVPYVVLALLVPNYTAEFNSIFPRWAVLCVVLTVIYYWDQAKNKKADNSHEVVSPGEASFNGDIEDRRKIVLVCMDEFVNDIYRKKLEERGFDFRAFSHVDAEFVNQMADLMPDIILMGLIMDGIDGYKLTEALKNDPRTKDIHIIGFSNLTGKEEIEKCFRLGMDDYWVMSELTPQQVFAKLYDWTKLIRYQKDGMFKGKDERLEEIMEHLRNKKYE